MDRNRDGLLKALIALGAAFHAAALVAGLFGRFTDGDEGGALILAKEVINGRVPILDINAHNQPLLYYLYGGWMRLFGFSIVSGRTLSAAAIFATGIILIWWTRRFTKDLTSTLLVYLLFITNLTFFKADIPVKPFALSNFLTFASFAIVTGCYLKDRRLNYEALAASGLLLGASMGVRLIFALPPLFALWLAVVLWMDKERITETAKKLAAFTLSVTAPMLPAIAIFIMEPRRAYAIWGGIYGQIYLGRGANPDFLTDVHGSGKYAMIRMGLKEIVTVPDTAFLIAVLAASTAIFIYKRRDIESRVTRVYLLAWLAFGGIAYVCANLYGNYLGYVNQLAVFAICLSTPLFMEISRRFGLKKILICSCAASVAVTAGLYLHFQARLRTSIFYIFRTQDTIITPAFVDSVSDKIIKKLTKEGDAVFDNWGVFVFASGRTPVRGFEYPTDSALYWQLMADKTKAGGYLYLPAPELYKKIERKEFALMILGDASELQTLTGVEAAPNELRTRTEQYYALYEKFFVKPTNAWVLIYRPKG
ncbi:MAG: hypothetical protein HY894_02490 [Deltaproteobacteria bacterium]|nr:hypothetical protein [Deltaproteobacteria bacterium]